MSQKIIHNSAPLLIIGAGPVGIMLAIRLKQIGYNNVIIFEQRAKHQILRDTSNRSVNITLSSRGISALETIECSEKVKNMSAPVLGRTYHFKDRNQFLPYTKLSDYQLYSIKRTYLELILVHHAEASGLEIRYSHQLVAINSSTKTCSFAVEGKTVEIAYDFLFGTDGVNSTVRNTLHVESVVTTHPFVYKKIEISAENALKLDLDRASVHLWKDKSGLLLSLPNCDNSHAGLLHLRSETLDKIYNNLSPLHSFFPVLADTVDGFEKQFFEAPEGSFKDISCTKWFLRNSILLLGDAAHASVPFMGQGTNCGLEDVSYLCNYIRSARGNLVHAALMFEQNRPKAAEAISYLSLQNLSNLDVDEDFEEFLAYKQLDLAIEASFPAYRSQYFLIAFSNLPYDEALRVSEECQPIIRNYAAKKRIGTQSEFSQDFLQEIYSELNGILSKKLY